MRYRFARTQDLFRKNQNPLAGYTREGVPCLEKGKRFPKSGECEVLHIGMGNFFNISIHFTAVGSGHKALGLDEVFRAIQST
jgi:hypothetical protein